MRRRQQRRRLIVEALEDRRLLAVFEVTTVDDIVDATDGVVSLREAIESANTNAGADTITFEPILFSHPQAIALSQGQLVISDSVTITGPANQLVTIDAGLTTRVLQVNNGDVEISHLLITRGRTFGDFEGGAGINFQSPGTLSLTNSQVSGNVTYGNNASGGGIRANGNLVLTGSTVAANGTYGDASDGAGIASPYAGNISITNSTLSGNFAIGAPQFGGGAIYFDDGDVTIENSTITGNTAGIGGGIGILNDNFGESLTIQNSIVAGNFAITDPDFTAPGDAATNLSVSFSLISDNSGTSLAEAQTADAAGNLIGRPGAVIDPLVGSLLLNGGTTLSHALLPGSPALNAGDPAFVAPTSSDQRGFPFARVADGRLDIGAYESQTLDPSFFVVSTTIDEFDLSTPDISLREAIRLANGSVGNDLITFDPDVFATPQTILLTDGELLIDDGVTILGPDNLLVSIDAQQQSRVFNITSNASDVSLANLSISGGRTVNGYESGGGIQFASSGTLTLTSSQVRDNFTIGYAAQGGGISATGNLVLTGSTIANNRTYGNFADGAGIASPSTGNITITNSTLSGNIASGPARFGGGAIYFDDGDVTIENSTISGNTAERGGGIGIYADDAGESLTIRNSIIAGNIAATNPDFTAPGNPPVNLSVSYNLIGDNTGTTLAEAQAADAAGNLVGTTATPINPVLSPLQFNGGLTLTHALLTGSPAINAGDPGFVSVGEDQRGVPFTRIADGRVDIGAYEAQPFDPALFVVTTANDELDFSNSAVSLREAIYFANVSPGTDSIRFSSAVLAAGLVIHLTLGELTISDSVSISGGPADSVTLDGEQRFRVFNILNTAGDVTLTNLNLVNGTVGQERGAGILFQSPGTLTLVNSQVTGTRTLTAFGPYGGGIFAVGNLVLTGSTIAGNNATGNGAGIASPLGGNISIDNSTLTYNSGLNGGAIYFKGGQVTITNSTITRNGAGTGGGIGVSADNSGESLTIRNSIVAGNFANINADFTAPSDANNLHVFFSLIGDNSGTSLTESQVADSNGNLIGSPLAAIDPMLGLLQYNGGQTMTNALLEGSPAIDAGDPAFSAPPSEDQRGRPFARVAGGRIDIGAYELQALDPALLIVTTAIDEFDYSNNDVSLREAINNANGSVGIDTITFDPVVFSTPQTIALTLGELFISEAVTIAGPGRDLLTIDAQGVSRVLDIDFNFGDVLLDGLTFSGGRTTGDTGGATESTFNGGGIRFLGLGTLTLANSTVSGNSTTGRFSRGGGIFSRYGSVALVNSTVTGNSTSGYQAFGGGIFGQVTLTDSTISGNSTSGMYARGGGIFVTGNATGSFNVVRSTISDNITNGYGAGGGGIAIYGGDISLVDSTVTGNTTFGDRADGGGVYSYNGSIVTLNTTISNNATFGENSNGGGVRTQFGNIALTNTTVSANSTNGINADGGGLWFGDAPVTIVNSTITGNAASGAGGGLGMDADVNDLPLTIHNSIIAGNTATTDLDFTAPNSPPTNLDVRFSLIGNNQGTSLTASATADADGNLIGTPAALINPQLGPLAFNGGSTQTHALLTGSPAIDAGSNGLVLATLVNDQRGAPFVRISGTVDIGAYELQTLDPSFFIVTTTNDELDYSNTDVSLREAINSANGNVGADTITFAAGLSGTIALSASLGQLPIATSLIINGNGATNTVIDAGKQGFRVIEVTGNSSDVTLSGMTITGGQTTGNGGGINFDSLNGTLILNHSTLSDNSADIGGGMFNTGLATLNHSTLSGNLARRGGGIDSYRGVTLNHSTLSGNSANTLGGGIVNRGITTLNNSTVSGNTAGAGAGVFNNNIITLNNSTLSGNTGNRGGGIFNNGTATLNNSTLSGNSANTSGGGLYNDSGRTATLNNNIVVGSISGGDIFGAVTGNANLIGNPNSAGGLVHGTSGNILGADDGAGGRMLLDVTTVLAPLAFNGGPTQTHALLAGSPAINAGSNALAVDSGNVAVANDQRGVPFVRRSGIVDIGAYEFQTFPASSFVVTTTDDELDYSDSDVTLREAINNANGSVGADTITFATGVTGTITLTLGQLNITDTVTITGPGQSLISIDANQQSRVLNIEGDAIDVTLSGLTVTGGRTIGNNSSTGDSTFSGGAIRSISSGSLTIADSVITGNQTGGRYSGGGGIYTRSGDVTLTGSSLSGNSTTGNYGYGGGIYTINGSVTLTGSTLSGNSTSGNGADGGGIRTISGSVTLTNSTLSGNSTSGYGADGGGIYTTFGSVTLTDSTLSGNSTAGNVAYGGGIRSFSGSVMLTNSTLSGNEVTGAFSDGGGLWFDDSVVSIVNSTITGNTASGAGGGLRMLADSFDKKLTIHNSIIAGNTAPTNPDFTAPTSPATNLEVRFSLIGNNQGTSLTASATPDANGNLIGAPAALINPLLGPLGFNGGSTQTHALLTGSPAINAGSNALVSATILNDQRGAPFVRQSGGVDIGAYEFQTFPASSFVVTTTDDELDYSNSAVSLREAINSANGNPGADTITFANGVTGTITLTLGELPITEALTLTGPGQELLSIDANSQSRVFNIFGGTMFDVTIEDLTLSGGLTTLSENSFFGFRDSSQSGGAIRFESTGTLTINRSTITGNRTLGDFADGGAIYSRYGAISLNNSLVSGNSTAGRRANAGGLYSRYGAITLTDSTVSGNNTTGTYSDGGAIYTGSGAVTLVNSTIADNSTVGERAYGGGIFSYEGLVTITGTIVSDNRTTGDDSRGGGVFTGRSLITITASTIAGNLTAGDQAKGGGIFTRSGGVSVTNSTISQNSTVGASANGGGIYSDSGPVTLTGSTISGNSVTGANSSGGGVHVQFNVALTVINSTITANSALVGGGFSRGTIQYRPFLFHNSIIAGNTATTDPDFTAPLNPATNLQVRNSLIGNNAGTTLTASATPDANGNLIGAPGALIDPLLRPLQNNGGPTFTHLLSPGSPALDAGNSNLVPPAAMFDQRGVTRTIDLPGIANAAGGDGTDIGAVEMVGVSIANVTANESDSNLVFTITLSHALPDGAFATVVFDTSDIAGQAVAGSDYTAKTQSVSFSGGGSLTQVVNVPLIDDSTFENDETFAAMISGAAGAIITTANAVGTIVSDDLPPTVTLAVDNATIAEAAGTATFTATLSAASSLPVTIDLAFTGTATLTSDYTRSGTQIVIPAGSLTGSVTVIAVQDTLDEADETIIVDISGVTGGNESGTQTATTTITDDDTAPTVTLAVNNATIAEAAGTATFTATLSAASSLPVTIDLAFTGTATLTSDYTRSGIQIVIPAGSMSGSVTVTAVQDTLDEANETIIVDISGVTNGTESGTQTVATTITDDDLPVDFGDAPALFPVTLADNGARHTITALFLGATVDAEFDGINSAAADADGSDEDGVVALASFISTTAATISSFSVISTGPGKLDAWIDFNNNGNWLDAGEQIFTSVDVVAGTNLLAFTIPAGLTARNVAARFRLSTAGSLAPTGAAADGEVEDYLSAIITGSGTTKLDINIPAGDSNVVVDGDNLVVRRGNVVLFQAPFAAFGDVDLNGTSLDDIFQVTILEALATNALSFDGGLGKDLLRLIEAGQTLDLTNANITLNDIESIDISGTGNNRLGISIEAVKAASTTTDTLEVIANSGDTVDFGNRVARERWQAEVPMFINDQFTHIIEERATGGTARIEIHNDRLFQNPLNRFDVDRDGTVSARDALRIINELRRRINRNQPPQLEIPTNDGEISRFYFDVNGRNDLTALDALFVINAIVRIRRNPDAEGETAATLIDLNQLNPQPNDVSERTGGSPRFHSELADFSIDDFVTPKTTPVMSATATDPAIVATIDDVMKEYGSDQDTEVASELNWLSVLSGA